MKKLLCACVLSIMIIITSIIPINAITQSTISEAYIPSEQYIIISTPTIYIETDNEKVLKQLIKACNIQLKDLIQQVNVIGYANNLKFRLLIKDITDCRNKYKIKLEEIQLKKKAEIYPTATWCWEFMRARGWSQEVCAGVLGNMMAETGGQTLNIKWAITSGGYYGLCMWSLYYAPNVQGMDLEQQMEYLFNTIEYQLNTYGFLYTSGFNYQQFLALKTPEEAALAFSKCYERNTAASYNIRKVNARVAYDFFIN